MQNKQRGFLLVEAMVYVVVLVLLLAATTYFIVSSYRVYRDTITSAQADRVGMGLINELVRETRIGESINTGASGFGVAAGYITINTDTTTKYFALSNGRVMYREGADPAVAFTPDTVEVSRFWLTHIVTPVSTAIRYDIGITYNTTSGPHTKYYRGVSILRQSYE